MNRHKISMMLAVLLLSVMTGCSLFTGNKDLLTVDQKVYSSEEGAYLVQMMLEKVNSSYDESFLHIQTSDEDMDVYIEASIYESVKQVLYMAAVAESEGLSLSEQDIQTASEIAGAYVQVSNEEDGEEVLTEAIEDYMLAEQYLNSLQDLAENSVDSEQCRVLQGKQIVTTYEDDTEKEEAWETISQIKARLDNGKTFQSLVALYNEEDVVNRTFVYHETTEQWEKQLFQMEDGEISDILEIDHGYMIFKCIHSDVEELEEEQRNLLAEQEKEKLIQSAQEQLVTNSSVTWSDSVWEKMNPEKVSPTLGFWEIYEEKTSQ